MKTATNKKTTRADGKPVRHSSAFVWDEQKGDVAIALAEGKTQQEVAAEYSVSDRTIRRWLQDTDFASEVDRLSVMTGISARAERLRVAKRVIRSKMADAVPRTDKDLLEWLKYAQSETDGIKLDLDAFAAAFGEDDASVADARQAGSSES
ncbi:MAG: helix-turn-helix domain-containing protein [Pyrinomonadaceae bacterium]